jgi:hypothetical protein
LTDAMLLPEIYSSTDVFKVNPWKGNMALIIDVSGVANLSVEKVPYTSCTILQEKLKPLFTTVSCGTCDKGNTPCILSLTFSQQ